VIGIKIISKKKSINMPMYEYKCSSCGHVFEKTQCINSRPRANCPKCNTLTKTRLISKIGGLIFKGSGFYSTDYRKDEK
jgi:putative FmdB family regulatory protein